MGAVPEEAEEAGGDKEEVGAARRWRGRGGGRGRRGGGGADDVEGRGGGRGSGVGRGEGKGIEGEGEGERGDRFGPGIGEGEGTILMAHHPSMRHKYIHTNGAPHPGAPLVLFFISARANRLSST